MSEPIFFTGDKSLTIAEIAELTGAEPEPDAALDRRIDGVGTLDGAAASELAFLESPKYQRLLAGTHAGACLISPRFQTPAPAGVAVLRCREPYRAFVMVARALFPDALRPSSLFGAAGLSPGAIIHPTARLESGVVVDPGAVIGPAAEVGAGSVIGPTAVIGPGVRIGRDCAIGAGCTLTHALVGDRVIIHPGCRIGQDGFGYLMGAGGHLKVPQIGRVILQDGVEIGAGTTIDRGALADTVIGEGSKIDNLVQIGHNVSIGRHCVVVAQSGISGSVTLEDYVVLGARVGISDHVFVGEGAQVGAASGVHANIPAGSQWIGYPARPIKTFFREVKALARLAARAEPRDKAAKDGDQD